MCTGTPGHIPRHTGQTRSNNNNLISFLVLLWYYFTSFYCDWFMLTSLVYITPDLLLLWFFYHIT